MDRLHNQLLLLFSMPIYGIIIPLEILLSNFRHLHLYSWKETVINVYLNLLNAGIDLLLRLLFAFALLTYLFQFHLSVHWNPFVYWVLLLFGEDLLFWLEHYIDHMVRIFWAVHVTHHSSPEYNLSTGFRSSVFMPVYKYMYFIPLVLLNFRPVDVIFIYSLTQLYGILVHTRSVKKLPWIIEYFFVTPSHHRVHHASNIPYLDRNMGMVFIIWDRMFGTFTKERLEDPPHYGITKPIENPHNPLYIIFHEWKALFKDLKKSKRLKDKISYLFRPPGWSPDGSTQTSKEMQRGLRHLQGKNI